MYVSVFNAGLFHRAIAMSGSLTSGWAMNRRPKDLAVRLAHNLGCLTSDSRLIHSCLLQHSAEQIVNATQLIKVLCTVYGNPRYVYNCI